MASSSFKFFKAINMNVPVCLATAHKLPVGSNCINCSSAQGGRLPCQLMQNVICGISLLRESTDLSGMGSVIPFIQIPNYTDRCLGVTVDMQRACSYYEKQVLLCLRILRRLPLNVGLYRVYIKECYMEVSFMLVLQ